MYMKGMTEDAIGRVQSNLNIPYDYRSSKVYTQSRPEKTWKLLAYHKTKVITLGKCQYFVSELQLP